jgi:3-oxoacyl-(acyl-carrier-protein) synthase
VAADRRVVVTGLGVVAPTGIGAAPFWEACLAGRSGARTITRFDASRLASQMACEVDFDPVALGLDEYERTGLDLHAQFAVAAAIEAVADAGLDLPSGGGAGGLDPDRAGVFLGCAEGPATIVEPVWVDVSDAGRRPVERDALPPHFLDGLVANAAPTAIAARFGLHGPTLVVSDACSSAMDAAELGFNAIRAGRCDVVLVGGADSPVTDMAVACYTASGATSTRNDDPATASRPFDLDRDGFVVGEGSAVLVLEEAEHAAARGATPYAEVRAVVSRGNGYHMVSLPADGVMLGGVMQTAMAQSGIGPADVGYVNAHGTSTPSNDRHETAAIKRAFGDLAHRLPVSSTKSMIGHTQGAASAHQMAVLCLSLRDQRIHPTINLTTPDPVCDLDYVTEGARDVALTHVMGNACGFGGITSSIVLARPGLDLPGGGR